MKLPKIVPVPKEKLTTQINLKCDLELKHLYQEVDAMGFESAKLARSVLRVVFKEVVETTKKERPEEPHP